MQGTDPVTLICGHGRCGTSMVMQMLAAGGYPVAGGWPDYEPDEVGFSTFDPEWLAAQHGRAVKLLDPQERRLGPGNYRAVWLSRRPREQARSALKILGAAAPRNRVRAMAAQYPGDTRRALAVLHRAGAHPILRLSFEGILADPFDAAEKIGRLVGINDWEDLAEMNRVVRHRPSACAPDRDLERQLIQDGPP